MHSCARKQSSRDQERRSWQEERNNLTRKEIGRKKVMRRKTCLGVGWKLGNLEGNKIAEDKNLVCIAINE